MADRKIVDQVLGYWFAIEFLSQDSYDVCTEESKLTREFKIFKKGNQLTKNKRRQLFVFEPVNSECGIYSQIISQAKECGMNLWGNLTFYVGKISRQACIERLAKGLGIKLEQGEKNSEYIPILSFQCTMHGQYIDHSLSLSTILWAISQIESDQKGELSNLLSSMAYSNTIKELEKKFFGLDELNGSDNTQEPDIKIESDGMPAFGVDSIVASKVMKIHAEMVKMYGKYFSENMIEEKNRIKYQLFKDAKAKEKYEDDNYMGLRHDFFSDDLKMVKSFLKEQRDKDMTGMLSDLVEYICAPYGVLEARKRHDFVRPEDKDEFYEEIADILNAQNAPLGKWPSRYMPALMQQVAINVAISDLKTGIFGEKGNIFSVNGPPGTGKTTLLKEIVANNIVEKAKILSQYDVPDDAFVGVMFLKGELNGAYAQYYPKWFRFKDDEIADFGILVTSCNNAAVENITRELPLEKGILDNLKIKKEGSESDSLEMAQELEAIRKLFSTRETKKTLNIYQKDAKKHGEYPEIYFTGYAQKFLGSEEKDAEAWGMVAAPLGKKSNIKGFYLDVLNPIWQDFMMKNIDLEERIPEYRKARDAFIQQLNLVKSLQGKLKSYGDVSLEAHRFYMIYKKIKEKNTKLITSYEEEIQSFQDQLAIVNNDIKQEENHLKDFKTSYLEADCKAKESEKMMKDLSEQEINYMKQALEAENSVSFITKLFRKSKYQLALDLATSYRKKAQECKESYDLRSQKNVAERNEVDRLHIGIEDTLEKLRQLQKEIKVLEEKQSDIRSRILQLSGEIDNAYSIACAAKEKCKKCLNEYLSAGEMKTGKILNDAFIEDVLSENEEVATKAQIINPWSTEEFNREREKLFYLALQMTKKFILSSKSCRTNLCILGQYWGLKTEDGMEKIQFKKQDKSAMIGSLFQTLFLLTPVISSTFASVGRLLRDMETPGSIGTLIIDEAGQAQPQMAVGALFRARKAIVVGDPKQVEPVVTDDIKLLRKAFSEPALANYKNNSLSVQRCADIINPFGTFYDNGTEYPEWVGCPLIVHRRCISPMYEISNRISYNGIMKQQTLPPSDSKAASFLEKKSQWINVVGAENGHGDHYVAEQGDVVCKMVELAFRKSIGTSGAQSDAQPSLYIITPFTSVVRGLRRAIRSYTYGNINSAMARSKSFETWLNDSIGTVHKFQGKEADEVIFVLGCDALMKDGYAVNGFVNSNIVNVAATRAKYRLYMVGDIEVWKNNEYVNEAKSIIDMLSVEQAGD